MIDAGAQRTPQAIAAAEATYVELKNRQPRDPRIDIAFALVLNNQRQFHKTIVVTSVCLRANPVDITAQKARIWAELSLSRIEDVIAHTLLLAQQIHSGTGALIKDDFSSAARFLGAVATCVSGLPAKKIDAKQATDWKADLIETMGPAYAGDFTEGEGAVSDRATDKRIASIDDCLATLSVNASSGYEAESRRLLSTFANQEARRP